MTLPWAWRDWGWRALAVSPDLSRLNSAPWGFRAAHRTPSQKASPSSPSTEVLPARWTGLAVV
jgi:hypothetical protein